MDFVIDDQYSVFGFMNIDIKPSDPSICDYLVKIDLFYIAEW